MNKPVEATMEAAKHLLVDGQWIAGKGPQIAVIDKYRLQPGAHLAAADWAILK